MKIQTVCTIACFSSFVLGVGAGILVGVTAAKKHYENEEKESVPQEVIDEICSSGHGPNPTEDSSEEKTPLVWKHLRDDSDKAIDPVVLDNMDTEKERKFVDYTRYRYNPEHEKIDESDPLYEVKPKPYFVEQDVVLHDNDIDCIPLSYYRGDRVLICEDGIGPDVIDEIDARDMLGDCLREIESMDVGEVYVRNEVNNRYYEVSIVDGWFEDPNQYDEITADPRPEKIRKRRKLE